MQQSVGRLVFLGTGNSEGIPVPFCSCSVCKKAERSRLRPSVLIQWCGKNLLIDVSPDFRSQMLTYAPGHLDGVFITHPHYDHIGGLDDLRAWYIVHQRPMPVVLSASTYLYLSRNKRYLLPSSQVGDSLPASLDFYVLDHQYGQSVFQGVPYRYVTYFQKACEVTGYRFGNIAYLTDMQRYDSSLREYLLGVDTVILSLSSKQDAFVFSGMERGHLTIRQAEEFAEWIGATRVIITHVGHRVQEEEREYAHVLFACDGMEVSFVI